MSLLPASILLWQKVFASCFRKLPRKTAKQLSAQYISQAVKPLCILTDFCWWQTGTSCIKVSQIWHQATLQVLVTNLKSFVTQQMYSCVFFQLSTQRLKKRSIRLKTWFLTTKINFWEILSKRWSSSKSMFRMSTRSKSINLISWTSSPSYGNVFCFSPSWSLQWSESESEWPSSMHSL